MVNRGPSKGCSTCKDRRIKCDEQKPKCRRCLKTNRECGGYGSRPKVFRFRHHERFTSDGSAQPSTKQQPPFTWRKSSHFAVPSPKGMLKLPEEDLAKSFFFYFFTSLGRPQSTLSGPLDLSSALVNKERKDSPLSLAFTAVVMRTWNVWGGPESAMQRNIDPYLRRALRRLQCAINSPVESQYPTTMLAAMLLQYDECLSAMFNQHKSVGIHHSGAVALSRHQPWDAPSESLSTALVHNALQAEISCALVRHSAVPRDVASGITPKTILQPSITFRLVLISIGVADCQARFFADLAGLDQNRRSREAVANIHSKARALHSELASWAKLVPDEWQFARLENVPIVDPPIVTYSGRSLVYPSVQIAGLWNSWRSRCLTILNILVATSPPPPEGCKMTSPSAKSKYDEEVQSLVDDICDSVPFLLGNLSGPLDRQVLTCATMEFPSYHDLYSGSPAQSRSFGLASRDLHSRHIIAQGPARLLIAFAYQIPLLMGPWSWLKNIVDTAQLEWLLQQFRRLLLLTRLLREPRDSPTWQFCGETVEGHDSMKLLLILRDRLRYDPWA